MPMNLGLVTDLGIHYRSIEATTEREPNCRNEDARSVRRVSDFVLVGKPVVALGKTPFPESSS